jgi:hypothetical protein
MNRFAWLVFLSVVFYGCGGPTLYKTVRYSRLSVNTVMLGTQEADKVNGEAFTESSDTIAKAAYDEHVLPVATEMGLEGEDDVCSLDGLTITDDAKAELQEACDAGFAQWCTDIKPIWHDHCLRTCIIHTVKDGLRAVEKTVNALQYVQENYSADSKFKQLKADDKLKWTDYAGQVKNWFVMALVQLGSLVHLLHETGIPIPEALNVITDISGGFVNMPNNYEEPACECTPYPENSGCEGD